MQLSVSSILDQRYDIHNAASMHTIDLFSCFGKHPVRLECQTLIQLLQQTCVKLA